MTTKNFYHREPEVGDHVRQPGVIRPKHSAPSLLPIVCNYLTNINICIDIFYSFYSPFRFYLHSVYFCGKQINEKSTIPRAPA